MEKIFDKNMHDHSEENGILEQKHDEKFCKNKNGVIDYGLNTRARLLTSKPKTSCTDGPLINVLSYAWLTKYKSIIESRKMSAAKYKNIYENNLCFIILFYNNIL